jgi:hypothetical protein
VPKPLRHRVPPTGIIHWGYLAESIKNTYKANVPFLLHSNIIPDEAF